MIESKYKRLVGDSCGEERKKDCDFQAIDIKKIACQRQYFTLPHVSYRTPLDYPKSRWITNCHIACPLDSTGVTVDPDVSQIVTWSIRRTPLDSTRIKVDSCLERGIQLSPPDCTGLCRTGLFWSQKWQWSPKRCVRWNPPDWFTFKKHTTYIYVGGLCRTVPDWTFLECKIEVESAGVRQTGPPESTGICWNE